jgi:signal transduction histidine kinase
MAHLAFLIVAAMLLIHVVMVKFAERDLIQAKVRMGLLLLRSLEQRSAHDPAKSLEGPRNRGVDPVMDQEITHLLGAGGFSRLLMVDKNGVKILSKGLWGELEKDALSTSRKAMTTGEPSVEFHGTTWGAIWIGHKQVKMSAPIRVSGRAAGGMAICADLDSVYETLRRSEKLILLYIALNAVVLLVAGSYLLSRTVIRPINKLLQIAEKFKEGEAFPSLPESSRNEIAQLYRSLNMMVRRLDENKEELKAHISSLEKANEAIKEVQDEIIRSEKMASIGRLATGVAHEIGNPVGIVLGYLDMLKAGGLSEQDRQDFLNRCEAEISRVNRIIRQLLDFSRPSSGEPKQVHVHELVNQTVEMLNPQPVMADIQVRTLLEAQQDLIRTDPGQLEQVFVNIILNSADAMGEAGSPHGDSAPKVLTIRTSNTNDGIELRFTDTGIGIAEDDLMHIFDPFYTTKEPGKGTGLGLAVCYRIVEGLGGSIRAKSTPGKGTTIVVDIPLRGSGSGGEPSQAGDVQPS